MKNMKEKYEDIKIPNRLDQVVNETIRNFEREKKLNKNNDDNEEIRNWNYSSCDGVNFRNKH